MLPLKTILYLALFLTAFFASIYKHPIIGVYAYLVTYNINPLGQWWGRFLPGFATRYAMLLALAIGLGVLFHKSKLRFGRFFEGQELLLISFVGVMWLSIVVGQSGGMDYNIDKMTKVLLVLLMASHVITTKRYFEGMIWVFVICGLYLGYELYGGAGSMRGGRYQSGVGGSDFGEGNFLAAHFGFVLPFVGVLFLKGGWKVRLLCVVAAAFIVNAIVITLSRGAFLGLAVGGVMAVLLSARLSRYRGKIIVLLIVGLLGGLYLTHDGFWYRMTSIQAVDGERDLSAQGRLDAWDGAWRMAQDYPLGVGVGRFFNHIGEYHSHIAGVDTHNTYLRCLAELGFHGFAILVLMIFTAFFMLWQIDRRASELTPERANFFHLYAYATKIALFVYLTAAMFVSSVYIEEFYWLLMFPVFLKRALDNEFLDAATEDNLSKVAKSAQLNNLKSHV
ncbi:O-antigen ligase family protein [Geoalkalibacter halelectricus]|uniref:O-antigen ligase family protein n=1 Tax=Geoalkalibacter halelectricus TaxID=2847045 RepID=A0ABY5ZK94_9BACT|nr:O-antigen ligase family protein [Geoalkalibacter halelectricus]MDO3379735.1 O-antigen ligase family protein [Geoalkalibacter halelectricus]UWZ79269.1 O-antigen ligase family protein [Geoalkalibacter halelectricus]